MKNNKCISGKVVYVTEELAEEALIQNHIRNNYGKEQGPLNIYQCLDCGWWHFTSKASKHEMFDNAEVVQRINSERRAFEWEKRIR